MRHSGKGQSLVETALVLPLLLLMLLGVLEVGWVLRNYMIMIQVSREAARVSTRPLYLDPAKEQMGWPDIMRHALINTTGLPNFDRDGAVILTYIQLHPYRPCPFEEGVPLNCDCAPDWDNSDDVVGYYGDGKGHQDYRYSWPLTTTVQSRYDLPLFVTQTLTQANEFNCKLLGQGVESVPLFRGDSMVIAEVFYEHHQLVGIPILSNFLTDPISLYAYTIMRYPDQVRDLPKPPQN